MKFLAEYKGTNEVYQIFGYDGNFNTFKSALKSEGYDIRGELKYALRHQRLDFGDVLVMQDYRVIGIFSTIAFLINFNVIATVADESDYEDELEDESEDEYSDVFGRSFEGFFNGCLDGLATGNPSEEIKRIFESEDEGESPKRKTKENFETYKTKAKDEAEIKANQARAFAKQALYSLSKKL